MRDFIRKIFRKPTLISVIGIVSILIVIPMSFYYLGLSGEGAFIGSMGLFVAFLVLLLFLLDRIILKRFSYIGLNVIEFVLLAACVFVVSLSNKSIVIDLSDTNLEYFVLVENNGDFLNSELKYSFPINKKIDYINNAAVINSISDNYQKIELKNSIGWDCVRIQTRGLGEYKIRFYSNCDIRYSKGEMDSLIIKEIEFLKSIRQ